MIQIVQSSAEQPFHLRVKSSGNRQTLVSGEQLGSRQDALGQLEALCGELGVRGAKVSLRGDRYWLTYGGETLAPIEFVDERTLEEKTR